MRNLCFLVIISGLLPLRGSSPLPTMSGVTEDHSRLITEDYNNLEEEIYVPVSTHGRSSQLCDYNPCREDQISCEELKATGCLCPWFTEEDEVPDAPTLKTVSWNGSEVVVRWCAPNSHVKAYVVTLCKIIKTTLLLDCLCHLAAGQTESTDLIAPPPRWKCLFELNNATMFAGWMLK
uniref:Fibronectin type-III domain-containing protein n=1 Tax=Oryzias latipes TaxID=8090 RepID=A0A3P9J779_ORYLA